MKILLINPPYINKAGIWKKNSSCMPPLGIAHIASFISQYDNVDAEILDTDALSILPQELSLHLDGKKYDCFGITSTTLTISSAYMVAENLRKSYPHAKIIMGGVHPTVCTDEVLSKPYVDFVIRGEGEITLKELVVDKKSLAGILGLSYKKDGVIIHNNERPVMNDLDKIPFPAYHLLPMEKYYPASGAYKRLPAISMLATRGCPGKCTFCYRIFGSRLRYRSARNIADNIKLLIKNYGIKEICFYDDTITANKKIIKELCNIILDERIDITWSCFSRVDCVEEEILKLMKKAGCHQILYGIETLDEEILKNIKKKADIAQTRKAFAMTKKAKIDIRAAYMLGNVGETAQTMRQTIADAIASDPEIAVFNITTPYPGTELFNWAREKGYLITTDWDKYDLSTPVINLPTVSTEEISQYYKLAYRKFYFRISYILKRILKIRTFLDLKVNFKTFFSVFGS